MRKLERACYEDFRVARSYSMMMAGGDTNQLNEETLLNDSQFYDTYNQGFHNYKGTFLYPKKTRYGYDIIESQLDRFLVDKANQKRIRV